MRILHTSDWHLGQRFHGRERYEEHAAALDWLVQTIQAEQVETLIVAGDVFDVNNPPNIARRLYYQFLTRLRTTPCRHVVIIAGNHDSPNMLEAPRELLRELGIHVIGAATEDIADELITLHDDHGKPEALVAAVPFLRDQDLRRTLSVESAAARFERVRQAISQHYHSLAAAIPAEFKSADLPVIATGHLYASGAQASDRQDNIYLGNLENISASDFPEAFHYVALGHIHRPQAVGGMSHIRYSGSLIPLSFSKTKDQKCVVLLDFEGAHLAAIREIEVPVFRRLKTITGELDYVKERLERLHRDYNEGLPAWVEVVVTGQDLTPSVADDLRAFVESLHCEILIVKLIGNKEEYGRPLTGTDLHALTPEEVFRRRCELEGYSKEKMNELMRTFRELREWMQAQDAD